MLKKNKNKKNKNRYVRAVCFGIYLVLAFQFSYAQIIEGSFESKFKRYLKGESFSGTPSLLTSLKAWKGERTYTQMVIWSTANQDNLSYEVSDFIKGNNQIASSNVQLMFAQNIKGDPEPRSCGTYPQPRLGDNVDVADALSFSPKSQLLASDPNKIWLRLNIPSNAVAGTYNGTITVKQNNADQLIFNLTVDVLDKTLPAVEDWSFHLDIWQYPYQILKHYNNDSPNNQIDIWSDQHFDMFRPYYQLLADTGQKVITAHIKDQAQGQPSMVKWTLKTDGAWEYNFTVFDKFINEMIVLGINKQINCFSPVGWNGDKIPYFDEASGTSKELDAPIGSTQYNTRWSHFLANFRLHLTTKGWFDKAVLYLDEIEEELLEDVIHVIQGDHQDWKIGLTYFNPISQDSNDAMYDISGILGAADATGRTGKISTFYTSCSQTVPNNYVTPENSPGEMSWMAWHVANKNLNGYLRWAFDYWTLNDPADVRNGAHTAGDYSFAYRSSNELNGEVYSSYRLEHLRNGIQDYEKIQILRSDLEGSLDPVNQEAFAALENMIARYGATSGTGADVLVQEGENLINGIVDDSFTYCRVNGGNANNVYVQYVATTMAEEQISYYTDSYTGGYTHFISGKIAAKLGSTFSLTVENSSTSNCARTKVWIDWNGDNDFDDTGEEISYVGEGDSCSNALSNTFDIVVPSNIDLGLVRMRIQVRDSYIPDPIACGDVTHSSTTDFDIELRDQYCSVNTAYNKSYFVKKLSSNSCGTNIDFENSVVPVSGYQYHTSSTATVRRNSVFSIDFENSVASNCARTKVWIDWNMDEDFDDDGEEVFFYGLDQSCENKLTHSFQVTVPNGAALGTTKMRVQLRDAYQAEPEACIIDAVSGTFDFNLVVTDDSSLSCTPLVTSPTDGTAFDGKTTTIDWIDNFTDAEGWRIKIIKESFNNAEDILYDQTFEASARSATITRLPAGGETLLFDFSWLKDGVWTSTTSVHRAFSKYCIVGGGANENYYVQKLTTTGGEDNINYLTSDFSAEGYNYHNYSKITAKEGDDIEFDMITSSASFCARLKVWVDWNGDNDFDDANEEIYSAGTANQCSSPISYKIPMTIPLGSVGLKRIRIQLRDAYQVEPSSCGVNNFTGTTDFNILVQSKIPVNLALNKPTTQISTGHNGVSSKAVDGNTNGTYSNNSVTHTAPNSAVHDWWQIDLGAVADIETINIFNRTDACCSDRLTDFNVYVSEKPFNGDSHPSVEGMHSYTVSGQAGGPSAVEINEKGRYVRVQLNGTRTTLNLAEVQVFGTFLFPTPINLALNKPATQISTGHNGVSSKAVDGNTNGTYSNNSVTHTAPNSAVHDWWQVDLGAVVDIEAINIFNRTDACCSDRLTDFNIYVSENPFSGDDRPSVEEAHSYTVSGQAGSPSTVDINARGRYVRVQLNGTTATLNLAEVQVFGIFLTPPPANLALNKPTTQISTGYNGFSRKAVDGDTNGAYFGNNYSVTHTTPNSNVRDWWQVDLGAVADIETVNIFNRTDCCSDRLTNFNVYVSENPFNGNARPSGDGVHSFEFSGQASSLSQININERGRYVRVQLNGTSAPLSLAEVEVYGFFIDNQQASKSTQTQTSIASDPEDLLPKELDIYPNPVDDLLNIRSKIKITKIALVSMNAGVLQEYKAVNAHEMNLDVSMLRRGLYILRIHLEDGQVINHRIVKNE